jgi:hypothetical protein
MPIRKFDDKGVLRTDGSVDQTAAYNAAEHVFDTTDVDAQEPRDDGTAPGYTHKKGGVATSGDKQSHQLETSEKEAPSQAAHDADPTEV